MAKLQHKLHFSSQCKLVNLVILSCQVKLQLSSNVTVHCHVVCGSLSNMRGNGEICT